MEGRKNSFEKQYTMGIIENVLWNRITIYSVEWREIVHSCIVDLRPVWRGRKWLIGIVFSSLLVYGIWCKAFNI